MLLQAQIQAHSQSIKIGLLIPDTSKKEIIHACEMAIEAAGQHRIFPDLPLELLVRSTQGPWGAGSKASVDLIYEDSVVALLCSLDGRNAHLAEQVAAKTQVVCIETRATDPSLTKAYVPWYLRCVPSDDQQAETIMQEIERSGGGKTAILCSGEYDSRMTTHSFIEVLARSGSAGPVILNIGEGSVSGRELADRIEEKEIRHLVLSLKTKAIEDMLTLLREKMPEINIYGTHAFTAAFAYGETDWQMYEGMFLVTSALPLNGEGNSFKAGFIELYGYQPSLAAVWAYDGMGIILTAIEKFGSDPTIIRKGITNLRFKDGLSGPISFDELGNRVNVARIIRIVDGIPARTN